MRWARMTVLALTAAGIVASAAPVSARALKVSRLPDALIDFCLQGAKCAPVAIGDFNGDRIDDAVFQQNLNSERMLHVLFGPFGNQPQPATKLMFVPENSLLAVDVADMNGDGQDELIVADVSHKPDVNLQLEEDEQSVNVIDFNILEAYGDEYGKLDPEFWIGRNRAPYRWSRTVPLKSASEQTGRLSVRAVDVNGDGGLDIVLGVDPTVSAAVTPRGGATVFPPDTAGGNQSEVIVQFMPRGFFTAQPGDLPDGKGFLGRNWPLNELKTLAGQESVRITGLGACARGGLGEVVDVTGDAAPDIIVRRCEGGPMPDQLGLVTGRTNWPATITIDGAISPSTPPVPPGPGPVTPPEPPRGGGYLQMDPRGPSVNIFDNLATFFTADLNGDGVLDIGFGQADKTHVWLGGSDVSARLLEDRSDRIFLGAGLGGSMANRSWTPTDLDGDGHRDLALTRLRSTAASTKDPSGRVTFESISPTEPLHVFAQNRDTDEVIDVTSDAPDAVWGDASVTLWALGDFNGDGLDDVMLGSPASAVESMYPVIYGPFLRR
ncbi:MAG: VCBS repeat-containing protein [Ardenticatenales bacterium]|nr:VCBS repeat-containing protein [Ardenticatenales bacterium]